MLLLRGGLSSCQIEAKLFPQTPLKYSFHKLGFPTIWLDSKNYLVKDGNDVRMMIVKICYNVVVLY